MSDIKVIEYSSDIDINSIFERKIELGAVIQFNLLQRVLEEFIKRLKLMNDKISKIESKITTISIPIPIEKENNLDILLEKTDDDYILKFEEDFNKNKENIQNKTNKEQNKEQNNINNKQNKEIKDNNKDNKDNIDNKENIENVENEDNNKDNIEDNDEKNIESVNNDNNEDNLYNKLSDKINKLEKMLNDFRNQSAHANKYHENKINELFKKISYINDVELLKIDNKPLIENNPDASKDLVNSIEKSLSERIENLEKRSKKNEDNIYSLKKDIVTIKNLNDNISKLSHTNQETIINLSKDLETKINLLNKKIDDEINKVKENCDNNYKENRYEIIKYSNELNDKLNNLINDLKKSRSNTNINTFSIGNEKLNDLSNDLKNYINKSITDTERYLKSIINNLNVDSIKKSISEIREEINQSKLLKKDIELINSKITDTIEKKIIELYQRLDAQSTDINLCNDTCNKTVKMVEYLSGQVIQTYQPDLENNNNINTINYKDLKQDIDMTSYMTKSLFKEEKNKILKKIEKTLEIEGENYIFIKKLEERLKFLASENDLRNMEQSFLSLIEELKIFFNKKFFDKNEAQKSIRLLELQLKQIIETGTLNNKDTEKWLLAKKPINNYVCASCETYLGELKNKNIFLPWNKIPSREDKKYRMGQGFSKMLQLVNMDILKNAEMMNTDMASKIYDKNDEKKIGDYKKLPKIKSQLNIHNQNKTYSIMPSNASVDHVEYGLNNSADNVEQIDGKKEGKNMNSSYDNKSVEKDKKIESIKSYNTIDVKTNYNNFNINKSLNKQSLTNQEPKVMRIVKLNKK